MNVKLIITIYLCVIVILAIIFWDSGMFPWRRNFRWVRLTPEQMERHINKITEYSLKVKEPKLKYLTIYNSTYTLFVLNFPTDVLRNIESGCRLIVPRDKTVKYTEFDKYPRIQMTIANAVETHIVNSERRFVNKIEDDRQMISIYLNRLYEQLMFI